MLSADSRAEDDRTLSCSFHQFVESLALIKQCRRGEEIYGQHDPAKYGYRVVSGGARRFALQASGRRRIVDFLQAGDFFGFARPDEHAFTAEALIEGTVVACYSLARIDKLVDSNAQLGRMMCEAMAAEARRLQARILILGQPTALEKVNSFLLEMAKRFSDGPDRMILPMSRYDVADYLALSVETVCRALATLKHQGSIMLAGPRRVRILNRRALEEGRGEDTPGTLCAPSSNREEPDTAAAASILPMLAPTSP
jgi:CRP-like cAMP-binding protein